MVKLPPPKTTTLARQGTTKKGLGTPSQRFATGMRDGDTDPDTEFLMMADLQDLSNDQLE